VSPILGRGEKFEEVRRKIDSSIRRRFGVYFGVTLLPLVLVAALPAIVYVFPDPDESLREISRWPWLIGLAVGLGLAAAMILACGLIAESIRGTKFLNFVIWMIELGQGGAVHDATESGSAQGGAVHDATESGSAQGKTRRQ